MPCPSRPSRGPLGRISRREAAINELDELVQQARLPIAEQLRTAVEPEELPSMLPRLPRMHMRCGGSDKPFNSPPRAQPIDRSRHAAAAIVASSRAVDGGLRADLRPPPGHQPLRELPAPARDAPPAVPAARHSQQAQRRLSRLGATGRQPLLAGGLQGVRSGVDLLRLRRREPAALHAAGRRYRSLRLGLRRATRRSSMCR
jgi:hypothetical protein